MSKERDLLGRWYNGDLLPEEYMKLMKETKELLDQPEQEPVAWIIETEIYGKLSEWVCTDKKHYMEAHDSIKEPIPLYLAPPKREQPEQEPVVKITSIHADGENLPVAITGVVLSDAVNIWDLPLKNNDLLFLAPPKREPLTPQQISVGNQSMLNVTREAFKDGVKWAEKEHGIGGGE
jgi:hypothetical protein